jgi:hypothetical protein
MTNDARISTALPSHPKTKKLYRRLGAEGCWSLVRLFLWAAANHPDGDLSGMTGEDIELAIDWPGEDGAFVSALMEVRFLDRQEGSYRIHDWQEHNPWAAGADARSVKARWNAAKRHHGEAEADRLVPEYRASRSATSKAISTILAQSPGAGSFAPSPSPSPSKSQEHVPQAARFPEFWAAYPSRAGTAKKNKKGAKAKWVARKLDAIADTILADIATRKRIDQEWKDGYPQDPVTYLNQDRWDDDKPEAMRPNNVGPSPRLDLATEANRKADALRAMQAQHRDLGITP